MEDVDEAYVSRSKQLEVDVKKALSVSSSSRSQDAALAKLASRVTGEDDEWDALRLLELDEGTMRASLNFLNCSFKVYAESCEEEAVSREVMQEAPSEMYSTIHKNANIEFHVISS